MAGSKREVRKGVWELRVYEGKDPVDGHHRYKSITVHGGVRIADQRLAEEVAKRSAATRSTVAYLLGEWMRLRESEGLAPTTLRSYQTYIDLHIVPKLGKTPLSRLTAGDLRSFYASLTARGLQPSSVRQVRAIISSALRFAEQNQWVDRNVALSVRPPKVIRTEPKIPTLDEIGRLLAACQSQRHGGPDLQACIAMAAVTGARVGELCALRWGDVDLVTGTVRITESSYASRGQRTRLKDTKTHASRTVPLDAIGIEVLRRRRIYQDERADRVETAISPSSFVLSRHSDGSGPPRPDGYSSAFCRLRDKLGLRHLHLHSLRHWQASTLIGNGTDLRTAADRLGHSSAVLLNVYAHALPERAEEAAELIGGALSLVFNPS